MADHRRATALISGDVQGVGFRYTTRRTAGGYDVTGYVRNLPAGGVEIVVEGRRKEVGEFLDAVREAMGPYIDSVDLAWREATGEYGGFYVRH